METKIENCKIDAGCGRSAAVKVIGNSVAITFSNDKEGMCPVKLSKHPELIGNVLEKLEKAYNCRPACLLYQAEDMVMYRFERIH